MFVAQIKKYLVFTVGLIVLAGTATFAQPGRVDIGHLDKLAAKAAETVDITLDESLLQLASGFLSRKSADEERAKSIIEGLKGIYVRSYKFDQPGAYSTEDVKAVTTQLAAPGWSRIVNVRSNRPDGDNAEVYVMHEAGTVKGVAIIAAEPLELTVVNIVGPVDIQKLSEIEGQFGIPKMKVEKDLGGKAK